MGTTPNVIESHVTLALSSPKRNGADVGNAAPYKQLEDLYQAKWHMNVAKPDISATTNGAAAVYVKTVSGKRPRCVV